MSSILDFSKNYNSKEKDYEKIIEDNKDKVQDIEKNLEKYKNMSSQDLMQELLSEASKLKSSGELNESTIENLKNTLSPMLSNEQNERLDSILNMLK